MNESAIIVVNAGSSSVKFSVFIQRGEGLDLRLRGQHESLFENPRFFARDAAGQTVAEKAWTPGRPLGHDGALAHLIEFLREHAAGARLVGVGFRGRRRRPGWPGRRAAARRASRRKLRRQVDSWPHGLLRRADMQARGRAGRYSSTCTPSSTTRSGGRRKKPVARMALRAMSTNRCSRQSAMPGESVGMSVSRPRK